MAYNEGLAQRVRDLLAERRGVVEKKMFGGLAFMLRGNMCVGVAGDDLMVRVGREQYQAALAKPHAREMDFTGKPLTGFVFVDGAGCESQPQLRQWVDRAVEFALSLPAK